MDKIQVPQWIEDMDLDEVFNGRNLPAVIEVLQKRYDDREGVFFRLSWGYDSYEVQAYAMREETDAEYADRKKKEAHKAKLKAEKAAKREARELAQLAKLQEKYGKHAT